jgi:hypothetical protein
VIGFRRKVSDLEIDSPDVAHYWLNYNGFNASILLNYYRADPKRELEIVMSGESWKADLLQSQVIDSTGKKIFEDASPITETYKAQMNYFLNGLGNETPYMNNLTEAVKTLEYCLS